MARSFFVPSIFQEFIYSLVCLMYKGSENQRRYLDFRVRNRTEELLIASYAMSGN